MSSPHTSYQWDDTPLLMKITLPSGTTYYIKDEDGRANLDWLKSKVYDSTNDTANDSVARQAIAGGVSFLTNWTSADYTSTTAPTAAKLATVPYGVTVYYNNGESTAVGTLSADSAQAGAFYLLYSKTQTSDQDMFDEYVPTGTSGSKTWEKIGDTRVVSITLTKDTAIKSGKVTIPQHTHTGSTTQVVGKELTVTNSASSVSFGTPTTDKVLGEATTFTVSEISIPGVSAEYKNIHATASGTDVGGTTTEVNTGYATLETALATSSIIPAGSSTVTATNTVFGTSTTASKVTTTAKTASKVEFTDKTASKATAGTAVSVATTGTAVTGIAKVTNSNSGTNTDFLKSLSVSNETLIIGSATITSDTSVTPAVANGTITPYTFADVACSEIDSCEDVSCSLVSASNVTVPVVSSNDSVTAATKGTAVTVATGQLYDGTGTYGDEVVVGIQSTGTQNVYKTVSITAQPTISLSTPTGTTASGDIKVVGDLSDTETQRTPTITVGSNDRVSAITAMPSATAAAQVVTLDKGLVSVLDSIDATTIGDISVTATSTIQAVTNATLNQ